MDFSEDFFGRKTNLTVSGQLEAEAFALAFRAVYTFGLTFRAENSNTARHAAEFWMIEPEIAFAGLEEDMELAEEMLKYVITKLLERAPEAVELLQQSGEKFDYPVNWGSDLQTEHERYCTMLMALTNTNACSRMN